MALGGRVLFLLIGLVFFRSAAAHVEFERLSMGDGLAQSSIHGMAQDRYGFLWFGTQYGLSRYDGYRFETFRHRADDSSSLSDSTVSDLLVGADGRLWVGTRNGLNRFDPDSGGSDRFFLHDPARVEPRATWVRQIIGETREGQLFVRLSDEVAVLQPNLPHLRPLDFSIPLSDLGLKGMTGLLDRSDRLWLLNDAGLWALGAESGVLERLDGVQPARGRYPDASLVETASGQLAVVVDDGLMLIEPGEVPTTRVLRPSDHGFSEAGFDAVVATSDGSLWLTSGTHFFRYLVDQDNLQKIFEGQSRDALNGAVVKLQVAEAGHGLFWFASQYGVSRWSESEQSLESFLHDPRNDQSIPPTLRRWPYSLFVDQDRTLWIGSELGGLARLPELARRFDHLVDQSPPGSRPFAGQNVVRGVVESEVDGQDHVWVGLDSAGIRQYRRVHEGRYELLRVFHASAPRAQRLPGNGISAMALDPVSSDLWVAQDRNLVVIDTQAGEVVNSNALASKIGIDDIQALLFSLDGRRLWVAHAAVEEFQMGADRLTLGDCPNGSFLSELGQYNLLELDDGRLIVGGRNGFSLVDFHCDRADRALQSQAFLTPGTQEIHGLARASGAGFWIGTRQSGLARVELQTGLTSPRLTWFDSSNGLADDTIYAILPEDSGRLWLSSNRGIMRFDPALGDLRHFTPPDGVQHFEFNRGVAHRGNSGHFYFGGINGLNAFRPEAIRILEQPPRLRLAGLRVNGQAQQISQATPLKMALAWDENDLDVSFVGLHSADPDRHRYQYWLEGVDGDWREPGFQRQVSYAGLDSGTYRLWVRAANSDGVWSEDTLLLDATVQPPPWATAWALLAYLLGGVLLLALFWLLAHRRQHQLEIEVKERTSELTQQQSLVRAQAQELERALQSRTAFFANVSHEFRTPLTLIGASLDDLNRRLPDAPPLVRARAYLDRLVRLVDQLLDLSELQAHPPNEPGHLWSISAVLGFIVRSFEPLAVQRGIRFSAEIEDHCLTACSQHHVEQVALNLISNALKYSPSGAEVTVALRAIDGGLCFIVADTGPGIDPSEHDAIFERFHRAEDARSSGQAGAGIGLALVRETVDALGGHIELDSALGQGSSFRVTLPGERMPSLQPPSISPDRKALELEVAQLSPLPPPDCLVIDRDGGQSGTLLIVEDQPEIRSYLAESLADEWQVIEAADGQQGLQRARQDQPDMILSDVMMPGLDGFQMLARLRDDLATSHIPVLLLTARHDRDSRMKGLMLSADDFLGKPFEIAELRVRLRRMRDNRRRMQRYLLDRGAEAMVETETEAGQMPDLSARDQALLESLRDWLDQVLDQPEVTVDDMAGAVTMETRTLQRKLRALTGQTPSEFLRHFRLQRAIELLLGTDRSVHDIALSCGFSSPQSFSRTFSREYGQPPDRWRRNRGPAGQPSN